MNDWTDIADEIRLDCENVGATADECRQLIEITDQATAAQLFGWRQALSFFAGERAHQVFEREGKDDMVK
jgi:hypothetical protein